MGKFPSTTDAIVDLAVMNSDPTMSYEIIPQTDLSSVSRVADPYIHGRVDFAHKLHDALRLAPDPNNVPRCGFALRTGEMPSSNSFFERPPMLKRSDFVDDALLETDCSTEDDDVAHCKCIQCFQPVYGYNYFCPQCSSGQEHGIQEYQEKPIRRRHEVSQAASIKWYGDYEQSGRDMQAYALHPRKALVAPNAHLDLAASIHASGPTTLMIRNIPGQYTPEVLINEWPNNGTYDFLYLPYSSRTQRNLTYAFVNFTSPVFALDFKNRWQKKRLSRYAVQKPLNIGFADVQGRDENLCQLKKKRLLHTKVKQCQPVVFKDGLRMRLEDALAEAERVAEWTCQRFVL